MYHKLACNIATACLNRKWITPEKFQWCIYAVEKRINFWIIFLFLITVSVLAEKGIEMLSFFISVTLLRRRIGGWRAPKAWECEFITLATALLAVFVVGPGLERLNFILILFLDGIVLVACFVSKPVYPEQLHLTEIEIKHNNIKKYEILCLILVCQMFSLVLKKEIFILYTMLGMLAAFVALVLKKNKYEKRGIQ